MNVSLERSAVYCYAGRRAWRGTYEVGSAVEDFPGGKTPYSDCDGDNLASLDVDVFRSEGCHVVGRRDRVGGAVSRRNQKRFGWRHSVQTYILVVTLASAQNRLPRNIAARPPPLVSHFATTKYG
jgi:hypothetical protein